jgi:ABC-type amino acid transport system permease subunit
MACTHFVNEASSIIKKTSLFFILNVNERFGCRLQFIRLKNSLIETRIQIVGHVG